MNRVLFNCTNEIPRLTELASAINGAMIGLVFEILLDSDNDGVWRDVMLTD